MKASEIRKTIDSMSSHVTFEYNGKDCGIDPLSKKHFDMWCGKNMMTAKSIDEVMQAPFFDGKSMQDIAGEIKKVWM